MMGIAVEITRFVEEHQPGVVECVFIDAYQQRHTFIEKAPILTDEPLWWDSLYPCAGVLACEVQSTFQDETGRGLVHVSTHRPYSVESCEGKAEFIVLPSQLRKSL